MKLLLLLAAAALTTAEPLEENRQRWRPAAGRDPAQYQPRTVGDIPAGGQHRRGGARAGQLGNTNNFDDICGISNPCKDKIVGGHEACENQWPWQVALFIDDAWFCGGSLISDEFVMTAAHCVDGASYFDIMAGAHNVRAGSEPHRVEITSYEGWTHEAWDPNTLGSDIALIKLPEKIQFNDYIRPACLPKAAHEDSPGELVTPVGWGKNSDNAGGITPTLQMVEDLPVLDSDICNDFYGIIYDGIVCIDSSGGKGVCNGDSGGSLNLPQLGEANKWTQVGVASFVSSNGCESGDPHGFTRVAHFREWLMAQTGVRTN